MKLVCQEICFTKLDTEGRAGQGLLGAVEALLTNVYIPAFKAMNKGWENLDSPDGLVIRNSFFNTLQSFASVLSGRSNVWTDILVDS